MIRLLERGGETELAAVCELDPIAGARIYTLCRVYGVDCPFLQLWMMENAGKAYGAVARFDNRITVSAEDRAGLEELARFLRYLGGFRYIDGSRRLCRELLRQLGGNLSTLRTMSLRKGITASAVAPVNVSPRLDDVYRLLCRVDPLFAQAVEYSAWLTHTSHLIRHRLGVCCTLEEEGIPVSTAGVYSMGQAYGVIGSLATLPEYRGRGYASAAVIYLCEWIERSGRIPAVVCGRDSMKDFYRSLGFEEMGDLCAIDLY